MIGSSDGIMILAWGSSINCRSFSMTGRKLTHTSDWGFAFLALLAGSFTKAGAFPFHSWIPDYTRQAPAASSAFLPASSRQTPGYLLPGQDMLNLFAISPRYGLSCWDWGHYHPGCRHDALVQHDYKKTTGLFMRIAGRLYGAWNCPRTALGVAGAGFSIDKQCDCIRVAISLSRQPGQTHGQENLDALGGLSHRMPITFACACFFALSISGIPPFNGFASKLMIYQAIIDTRQWPELFNRLWILCWVWLFLGLP